MARRTLDAARTAALARGVVGIFLVGWPDRLDHGIDNSSTNTVTTGLTRALGVRHLLEAAVLWRRPSTCLLAGLTAVDLIHTSSMVAIAAGSTTYRRFGVAGVLLGGSMTGVTLAARARAQHGR